MWASSPSSGKGGMIMNTKYIQPIILLALFVPVLVTAAEFQNVGRAGANFLQIPGDAVSAALGDANVAMLEGVQGLYGNPAAIALSRGPEALFSYTDWIADTKLMTAGATMGIGTFGTIGIGIVSLSMDAMDVTTEFQPNGTGETFDAGDLAAGLSFGSQVTDRFSWGVTARFVHEYIWDNTSSTMAFDVGSTYRADFMNIRIGMIIGNFGGNLEMSGDQIDDRLDEEANEDVENNPQEERLNQDYTLPQYFNVGIAFDPWVVENHRLTLAAMANDPNDNETRLSFGAEYTFQDMLFLRAGYKAQYEEQGISAGAGFSLELSGITSMLDYAFTDFGILGSIHHITLRLNL